MALAAGALLASAQLVPTVMAGDPRASRHARDAGLLVAAPVRALGDGRAAPLRELLRCLPRGSAVDGRAELRPRSVLLLALRGAAGAAAGGRRGRRAASAGTPSGWRSLLVFLAAALGGYTPLYPLARRLVPPLMYFRFPVKYIVVSLFACAVLAADGFSAAVPSGADWLEAEPTAARRPGRWPTLAAIAAGSRSAGLARVPADAGPGVARRARARRRART